MKKHLFGIATMLFAGCFLHVMASDRASTGSEDKADGNKIDMNTAVWKGAFEFEKGHSTDVSYSIVFPKDTLSALSDSIRSVICQALGDTTMTYKTDIPALLDSCGSHQIAADTADIRMMISSDDIPYPLNYSHQTFFSVSYEDKDFITMDGTFYSYEGGAHGGTASISSTFRKSDGKQMGWELLKGMTKKEIQDAIKAGLREYFEVKNMDELRDCLILDFLSEGTGKDIFAEDFPLPALPPYLTKDGVCILYQQYEIAPYAAGMPSCIIKKK